MQLFDSALFKDGEKLLQELDQLEAAQEEQKVVLPVLNDSTSFFVVV